MTNVFLAAIIWAKDSKEGGALVLLDDGEEVNLLDRLFFSLLLLTEDDCFNRSLGADLDLELFLSFLESPFSFFDGCRRRSDGAEPTFDALSPVAVSLNRETCLVPDVIGKGSLIGCRRITHWRRRSRSKRSGFY